MYKHLQTKFLALLAIMLMGGSSAWAETVTVSMNTFSAISGNVGNDSNISYEAAKGTAATAPAVNSNEIRVYQNGGTFSVTANNNVKINSVTLGSSMATTVTYAIDGGTASDNNSIDADGTLTVDNLDCSSVLFTCTGTSKTSRLYVNYLSVTYEQSGDTPTPTTYSVNFDAGNGTFVGNEDFPNTSNTKEAGEYTLPSVTPVSGYTFDGWVTTGNDTPLTGSYTVSGNVNFTAQYSQSSPASATIDLRGVTTALSFNAGAFTANGSGYQSYENVTYVGSNNLEYAGWTLDNVMHSGNNMQMRKADGRVTMPTILSDAGVKISVAAITNDVTVSDGTNSGTNTLEIASTSADVTISAGSKYAVISTITITPNEINAVATPTFSVAGGEYIDAQTVEITCAT